MVGSPAAERSIVTVDAAATHALGAALARVAEPGDLLCLSGELGAGKTLLAKGFGAGLSVTDPVVSPSFVLMAEYAGRLPLFHVDLYRVHDPVEAIDDGLLDEREGAGVTIIEWAERLGAALPADRLDIAIKGSGDAPRTILIRAAGPSYARYLAAACD
jgi:tRNA threonylcarbamoyladenosine biosynthesis protein TsaE